MQGAGREEREEREERWERWERWAGRRGVLAAGPDSPFELGAPSEPLSSTVSRLSCRERSAEVESSTESITEDSSGSGGGPEGGDGLWRETPSSPLMVSTRRLHDRPK